MATPVNTKLDFGGGRRIINLAAGAAAGEPVVFEQLNAALEGLAWKDNVRVASQVNVTLASPGASIDGISLAINDRVLIRSQSTASQNGIYVWNGAAVPMTRAADADTFDELESAVVTVDEGTDAGSTYRQTQVNGTIAVNDVVWATFGATAPQASETTPGRIEIATQAETDTGTDDVRAITPLKLANYVNRAKRFSATIGDGIATSIGVTHNLGTRDVQVYAYENSGLFREIFVEKQHTTTNQVTLVFDTAPASNAVRVVVLA